MSGTAVVLCGRSSVQVSDLLLHVVLLRHCTTDLQMVNMSLRILSKPSEERLPTIFKVGFVPCVARFPVLTDCCCCRHLHNIDECFLQNLGLDWEERVLPSIGNEVVKSIVAQYNAEQLLTQREKVSRAVGRRT